MEEIPLSKSMQETDESDETLSLCDLPMYSPEGERGERDSSSLKSTSDHDEDCFEFFSEELNPFRFPPENIVFCGKIITSRKPVSENLKPVETKQESGRKWRFRRLLLWNFNPIYKSRKKSSCNKNKKGQDRHEFPYKKLSILTSSSSGKSRWYLFLFGITRFPTEMELRDIKNRQSRRRRSPSLPMFQLKNDQKTTVSKIRSQRIWSLIKALSCGGGSHQKNAVVSPPVSFRSAAVSV